MKKSDRMKRTVVVLFSLAFVISAWQIVKILHEEKTAEDCYDEFQNFVIIEPLPETSGAGGKEAIEQAPISVDFTRLQEQYPDVIGWLYCEGTEINYPVAQGKDNSQYLRHLLDGSYNTAGTLFADYRNKEAGVDRNFLIYGHNMKNETMFGSLVKYKEQAYFKEHPILYYFTSEKVFEVELIAGYVTSVSSDAYRLDFGTEENIGKYINGIREQSTFRSNAEYEAGDCLMTLSTCSYEYSDARYVIVGRLKEI